MKRQNRLQRVPCAAAVAAAALVLAACSPSEADASDIEAVVTPPENLVADGTLTYGVAATFPPFEYLDGTEITGFDVEMAEFLAASMGLETSPLDIDFDGLIPALQGERVDIINSAMYINEERSEQVDFVPYMEIGEAILVPSGNPLGISELPEDLSGLTVSVTRGAIGETYMNEFNEELEEMGLEPMTILALPTNQDAQLAVESGRADAFDTSTPGAAHIIGETEGTFEIAGTFSVGTEIGIAVRKGDENMQQTIEAAIQEFVDSGEYASLLEKYNLPPESSIFD